MKKTLALLAALGLIASAPVFANEHEDKTSADTATSSSSAPAGEETTKEGAAD